MILPISLANGGISIPASYSAHYTPIMAPKIHADILSRRSDPDAPETPYVVMLQAIESLAENEYIHRAWDFHHPLPANTMSEAAALGGGFIGLGDGGNDHNIRKSKATFKIPRRGVVHGLAGYFESVLFGDVELSTRPDTIDAKSKDMISWFPIFFPLKVRNGNSDFFFLPFVSSLYLPFFILPCKSQMVQIYIFIEPPTTTLPLVGMALMWCARTALHWLGSLFS